MQNAKEKVVMNCMYDGCSTNKNGITTLKFSFPASEIGNYINVVKFLNVDVKALIDVGGVKAKIGVCRVKNLRINREGDAVLQLETMELDFNALLDSFEKNIRLALVG